MNAHRKGTRQKIASRLAEHAKLVNEFMAQGLSREEASAKAFEAVQSNSKKSR